MMVVGKDASDQLNNRSAKSCVVLGARDVADYRYYGALSV